MTLIDLKNIRKTYNLGSIALNAVLDISMTIEKGDFLAIMGASGSGKSTFMNIIGCLDKQTAGEYLLDGINVKKLGDDHLAQIRNQKIGFVFQGFNLLARATALENVELPMIYSNIHKNERTRRAMETLQAVGLGEREYHFPNQLSGGQQQRVAIARAIVNNAPIILADEPTGNLDTKTSKEIMELFVRLNKDFNKTIILVTHESEIAAYSRRIITFRDGLIISDKTKES